MVKAKGKYLPRSNKFLRNPGISTLNLKYFELFSPREVCATLTVLCSIRVSRISLGVNFDHLTTSRTISGLEGWGIPFILYEIAIRGSRSNIPLNVAVEIPTLGTVPPVTCFFRMLGLVAGIDRVSIMIAITTVRE